MFPLILTKQDYAVKSTNSRQQIDSPLLKQIQFLKKKKFIWLCWVLVAAPAIFTCGMWELVPRPGIESGPLHRELGLLATGPPGKSPNTVLDYTKEKCFQ